MASGTMTARAPMDTPIATPTVPEMPLELLLVEEVAVDEALVTVGCAPSDAAETLDSFDDEEEEVVVAAEFAFEVAAEVAEVVEVLVFVDDVAEEVDEDIANVAYMMVPIEVSKVVGS